MSSISRFFNKLPNQSKKRCRQPEADEIVSNGLLKQQHPNDIIVIDDDDHDDDDHKELQIPEQKEEELQNFTLNNTDTADVQRYMETTVSSSLERSVTEYDYMSKCTEIQTKSDNPENSANDDVVETLNIADQGDESETSNGNNDNVIELENDTNGTKKTNPFAKFAFGGHKTIMTTSKKPATNSCNALPSEPIVAEKRPNNQIKLSKRSKKNENNCEFVPMKELSSEKQNEIVTKWHSLINPSTDNIEERRFHVLVAATIHARCQEQAVRKGIKKLYETIHPFTVHTVAAVTDPTTISNCITNLQYHNMKAKHIIQAANEIIIKFHGNVPELENELKSLTGIGPVFADLLSFVNTREMHEKMKRSSPN